MPHRGADRTLKRLARSARRGSGPAVLLYHRVAHAALDPQLLAVAPERFAEHLQLLAARFEPLPLADLVGAALEGRAPARAVAVTFDDGYADNLLTAKPLLKRAGVPATVFVASGYVGRGGSFWWDELERLLLRPGTLPAVLTLELGAEKLRWELGVDAGYSAREAAARYNWTVLNGPDPGPRQRIYRALCERLRELDEPEREGVLQSLRSLSEPAHGVGDEVPRPLTADELGRLADGGLVEVGAHSATHPLLARLPAARQREEIAGSKQELEDAIGRPVSSFAYPYGEAHDFDETTVALVRAAGFERACANFPGRVGPRTDPFRLPRLLVRAWSTDELSGRLAAIEW